jgi:hypothetical protein
VFTTEFLCIFLGYNIVYFCYFIWVLYHSANYNWIDLYKSIEAG